MIGGEQRRNERGAITVFFVVLVVVFFSVVAVLAEGGRRLTNLSRAEDIAAEVARASAATLDLEALSGGISAIDTNGAARQYAEFIVAEIPDAEIESFTVTSDRVVVQVRVSGTSFIPGLDIDGVGSHVAFVLDPFSDPTAETP